MYFFLTNCFKVSTTIIKMGDVLDWGIWTSESLLYL